MVMVARSARKIDENSGRAMSLQVLLRVEGTDHPDIRSSEY